MSSENTLFSLSDFRARKNAEVHFARGRKPLCAEPGLGSSFLKIAVVLRAELNELSSKLSEGTMITYSRSSTTQGSSL